jgi:hypothetical protein
MVIKKQGVIFKGAAPHNKWAVLTYWEFVFYLLIY